MSYNLFVAYDLAIHGQNYVKVEAAINSLGRAVKIQLSMYYLKTDYTYVQAEQHIRNAMDSNDRLIVIEASNASMTNLLPGSAQFVTDHWNL